MAIRKILQEPDPILRQISQPVETVGIEEQQLMDDMLQTMLDAPGIGLAAIQIGVPRRVIVLNISMILLMIYLVLIILSQRIKVEQLSGYCFLLYVKIMI